MEKLSTEDMHSKYWELEKKAGENLLGEMDWKAEEFLQGEERREYLNLHMDIEGFCKLCGAGVGEGDECTCENY